MRALTTLRTYVKYNDTLRTYVVKTAHSICVSFKCGLECAQIFVPEKFPGQKDLGIVYIIPGPKIYSVEFPV